MVRQARIVCGVFCALALMGDVTRAQSVFAFIVAIRRQHAEVSPASLPHARGDSLQQVDRPANLSPMSTSNDSCQLAANEVDPDQFDLFVGTATTRRIVLGCALATLGVEIDWRDEARADDLVRGHFTGTREQIARDVLRNTNYVMFYSSASRLSHVTILQSVTSNGASALSTIDPPRRAASQQPPAALELQSKLKAAEQRHQRAIRAYNALTKKL